MVPGVWHAVLCPGRCAPDHLGVEGRPAHLLERQRDRRNQVANSDWIALTPLTREPQFGTVAPRVELTPHPVVATGECPRVDCEGESIDRRGEQ
jgi:hypothetical protein